MGGYIGFGLDVHILGAVETGGGARAYAVGAEYLDGFFFERFVSDEIVKIVGGEVRDRAAVREFGFGACWSLSRGRQSFL